MRTNAENTLAYGYISPYSTMFMYDLNGYYKGDHDAYNMMIQEHLDNHYVTVNNSIKRGVNIGIDRYDSIYTECNAPLVLMYKLPDETVFFVTQYSVVGIDSNNALYTYFTLDFMDDILSMESVSGVYSYMKRMYERCGSTIDISINTIEEFKTLFYGDCGRNDGSGLNDIFETIEFCLNDICVLCG